MPAQEVPAIWSDGPWANDYDFVSQLGDGGQGLTFHARSKSDQSDVAVKILRPDRSKLKARRRMFREVKRLQSLSTTDAKVPEFIYSNIDEALADPTVHPYVVMEYISGKTLLKAQQDGEPMSLADALDLIEALINTVEIAHSEETTHRDIKPQNIVLKDGDYAKPFLIDFGLSFNRIEDLDDGLTSIRESIGNAFLTLPETEATGSDEKH